MTGRHAAALVGSGLLVFGITTAAILITLRQNPLHETTIVGAVLVDAAEPRREMPIANAKVTAEIGTAKARGESDSSGFFSITVPTLLRLRRPATVHFERQGFLPATVTVKNTDDLVIARLQPVTRETTPAGKPLHRLSNIRIRYSMKTESFINVATAVREFEVVNTGGIPCVPGEACSPDRAWKAATREVVMDASEGNEFRNTRVSCIAGPCPFTRIEAEGLRENGRLFAVSVLNWSDTATFLVEADVMRAQTQDLIRQEYPIVFGRGLSFTLPPTAEGPSIEAELDDTDVVFPLGPDLLLSWARCSVKTDADQSKLFSCELDPKYRFQ